MRVGLSVLLAALLIGLSALIASAGEQPATGKDAAARYEVRSPDGEIELSVSLKDTARTTVPTYRITYQGKTIIGDSRLGRVFEDSSLFAGRLAVEDVIRRSRDTTYEVVHGASATARNHYNELVLMLREETKPHRRIDLMFRVYNDGAAFRYRIPEQEGLTDFTITEERSTFAFTGNPTAYTQPLGSYTTPHEGTYEAVRLRALSSADSVLGVPLLLQYPEGPYVAVTEADLTDYAGMYLSGTAQGSGVLVSQLSPYPDQPTVKVKAAAPHVSPWRVVMIGDEPGALIESNIIINLNDPSRIEDTSWIEAGKILFPWWNGFVVKGADIDAGVNTATIKYYIDFCAEQGIEYMSLDGLGDQVWYGGPVPYQGADITTGNPELDVQEVVQYAHRKGVELRLWIHWKAVQEQMDKAFPVYEQWGIEGVMLDFMNRDDQQMVNFYHEVLRKAAEHHLTVNFHGAYKPTGIRRTYPNLLTREAVRNLEFYKLLQLDAPLTAEHEVTVPFTRMLAGPLDFHHGGFRAVREEEYEEKKSFIAPVVIGTRARALAMYVVYFDPLPMLVDYPAAYRGEEGFEFLKRVPTTWDDTNVLHGAVGDYITIARRKGNSWYVGSMTDGEARSLEISLDFLPEGAFVADVYADVLAGGASPNEVNHETLRVTRSDTIRVQMAPRGGHVLRLRPATGLFE